MRELIRWTPLLEPFEEMDKFFSNSLSTLTPAVDVYEDNDAIVVETPLAGVSPQDVNISIENDVLTIEGKMEKKSELEEKNYYRKEVRQGAFHRSVGLPTAVKAEEAKATFKDGLLKITVPKADHVKPRTIKVETM